MKPLNALKPADLAEIKAVCFDSDGVLVKKGTQIIARPGYLEMKTYPPSKTVLRLLKQIQKRFWLVLPSGRSLIYLSRFYELIIGPKTVLVGENGIFGLWRGRVRQFYDFSPQDQQTLQEIKSQLRQLMAKNNDLLGFGPKQFLISLYARRYVPAVEEIVRRHPRVQDLSCLWNGEAFDISFRWLTKASGVEHFLQEKQIPWEAVLAVGNDPNDRALAERAGISISTDPQGDNRAKFQTTAPLEQGGWEVLQLLARLAK